MQTRGPVFRKSGGPTGWNNDEPPVLDNYSADPKYDLQMIVTLVGVRPMILWSWEQQLGVASVPRSEDEPGASARRYSERDLVAFLWLREQIVGGKSPAEAAATLHEAQANRSGFTTFEPREPREPRRAAPTRPLSAEAWAEIAGGPASMPNLRPTPSAPNLTGPKQPTAQSLGGAAYVAAPGGAPQSLSGDLVGPAAWRGLPAGALPSSYAGPRSGPLTGPRQPPMSGPLRTGGPSGPLGGFSRPDLTRPQGMGGGPYGPGGPVPAPELRTLLPQLVRAFASFDTIAANRVIETALSSRNFETICLSLLQPALARIGELYARREVSMPEERFAQQYARAFLFSVFHRTPERPDAPVVIVACAPHEFSEIPALMLAVLWRRADMHVVYLGPDMDGDSLFEKARETRPALVSLAISTPPRVRTLARISKRFANMEGKRPIFAYCGPVFTRHPELKKKVEGIFLGDDAWQATWHLKRLLGTAQAAVSPAAMAGRFSSPSLGS